VKVLLLFISALACYLGNVTCEVAMALAVIYFIANKYFSTNDLRFSFYITHIAPILFAITLIVLSSLYAGDYFAAFKAFLIVRFIIFALILAAIIDSLSIKEEIFCLRAIAASIAFITLNSLFQYFSGYDILGNKIFNVLELVRLTTITGKLRVGFALSIMTIIAFTLLIRTVRHLRYAEVCFYIFSLASSGLVILLSGERASSYLFIGAFILYLFFTAKYKKTIILFALGMISLTIFLIPSIYKRHINNNISELSSPNNSSHIKVFYNTLALIKESPIIGYPHRSFMEKCKTNNNIEFKKYCTTHPHNIYLEVWFEGGIFALIAMLIGVALLIKTLISNKAAISEKGYLIFPISFLVLKLIPIVPSSSIYLAWSSTPIALLIAVIIGIMRKN
jgi:O-antigen ligase